MKRRLTALSRSLSLSRELAAAKHQLDWFKRQVFGQKSERRIIDGARWPDDSG